MTILVAQPSLINEPLDRARILHNRNWLSGTPSASSVDASFFLSGADNSLTYERWKPAVLPAWWMLDVGETRTATCCAIGAHTLGSSGATVSLEYLDITDGGWVEVGRVTPATNDPIMFLFPETPAQYWRVFITGTIVPEIGVVKFGTPLVFEHPVYAGLSPSALARMTMLRSNHSETGEVLGRTKQRSYLAMAIEWRTLTSAWIEQHWRTVQVAIEDEAFFIAWRADISGDVALAQTDRVPVPQTTGQANLMSVSLQFRGHSSEA